MKLSCTCTCLFFVVHVQYLLFLITKILFKLLHVIFGLDLGASNHNHFYVMFVNIVLFFTSCYSCNQLLHVRVEN